MPNYKIEGDVNFYDELYKSLDEPEDGNDAIVCLITNKPLEENCVTLSCNHKFNYDAIYNDIYNHKKKYNAMERNAVKSSQIRCPYCRTIQNNLLPEKEGYKKVHGVNFYDEEQENISKLSNVSSILKQGKCCYKNPNLPDSHPGCYNKYVKTLYLDDKTYCSAHYSHVFSKLYKEKKLKEKQEREQKKALALLEKIKAKENKQKAKEDKQKAKDEEKLKKAAEKIQKNTQKAQNENVIISATSSSSPQTGGCIQLLKTGKNKGTQCGCKISQDGLCGRHYKLLHPVSPEEQI
jgi:hypothetical protein